MTEVVDNPRAVIGGNSPPPDPPTPYQVAEKAVERIYGEATLWLDGATVENADLADGINGLINELGKAKKLADETRKTEKKPFDDSAKAVQALYLPLIEKCDTAIDACKRALQPWLKKLADEIEAKAHAAREEATRKQREAEIAIRASDSTNLIDRSRAEALVKDAKRALKTANRAENQTATAGGSMGRATGLRSVYSAVIIDEVAASRYYWKRNRAEVVAFIQGLAEADVRNGMRVFPDDSGIVVSEEKKAV